MPANNINSGETLIRKEPVVAGRYLSPQKSAPLLDNGGLQPRLKRSKMGRLFGHVMSPTFNASLAPAYGIDVPSVAGILTGA